MNDNDILRQIALLNPRIISEVDGNNEFMVQSDTSSPIEASNDHPMIENDDDNDILNLWSSTKIFFDPFDPSKINLTTQSQSNVSLTANDVNNNNNAMQLTEREIDRQRYTRLKQQQQSVYARRGRRPKNGGRISKNMISENNNIFNKNNLLNINEIDIHNMLLNNNNNNNNNSNNNNNNSNNNNNNNSLLQNSSSNIDTTSSLATTHALIPNVSSLNNNNIQNIHNINNINSNNSNKINNTLSPINNPVSPINFNLPLEKSNNTINSINNGKKNKDLYSQLLDSINVNKSKADKEMKEIDSYTILSKINDRSKEIADKKKRRSAATMRCRERKKNQLQKKEQYIKYLENQILFLNGSILHMSNEITWLRRSFLDQYGEQSLKNIYMKNGFKDINLNNVLYPGTSSFDTSTFTNTSMLSPDLTLSPGSGDSQNQEQTSSPELHQNMGFLSPSQSSIKNIANVNGSNTATITSTAEDSANIHSTSINSDSREINNNNNNNNKNNNNININNSTTSIITTSTATTTDTNYPGNNSSLLSNNKTISTNTETNITKLPVDTSDSYINQKDIFNQLDIETLNEFASLSKEQRDIILKILEKKQIHSNSSKTSEMGKAQPPTRDYINIANDVENSNHLSKQPASLLNLVPTTSTATSIGLNNSSSHYNSLTTNILDTFNNNDLQTISSFHSTTSMTVASSLPSSSSSTIPHTSSDITKGNLFLTTSSSSNTNAVGLSTTTSDLLKSINTQNSSPNVNAPTSSILPTSTANSQNSDYINLENLIYYI